MIMNTSLLQELTRIDTTAHQGAVIVSDDPSRRTPALIEWAATTQSRLIDLAKELGERAKVPDTAHIISESILDLHFIEKDSNIMSLRLGYHRAKKRSA